MIGKRAPFRVGQRVKPSGNGFKALVFYRHGRFVVKRGTVTKVDEFNCPTILWDGRKRARSYHPDFIDPIFRATLSASGGRG